MQEGTGLSRDELLELAQLGALGVLDDVDAARLERAVAAASPTLQAEVMALEHRVATDPSLLSAELPPASLRLRVLARLADEMESDSRNAQPLATIGPVASARAADGMRQLPQADRALTAESMRELIEDLSRRGATQKAPPQLYWRAASFVLLASLCVSLYFNNRLSDLSRRLADSTVARSIEEDVARAAQQFRGFDFAGSRRIDLVAVSGQTRGQVGVFADPSVGRVAVLGVGFAAGEIVRVNVLDTDGAVIQSSQFRVAAAAFGGVIDFASAPVAGVRVEVVGPDGDLLFRQA